MNTKRFFLSWIFSSLIMFSLSYLWHGVFLNDLQRLSYPKEIFLTGSVITYLILGFLVTKIYLMKFPKNIAGKPLIRGLISGALLGICTYVVSLVVGVSFNSQLTPGYILFDIAWQTIEQTCGGITVALVYISIYEGNPVEVIGRKMFGD
ncbi:MAG: hypothetical protein ACHQHP_04040 [Bacteroidia bacterium]